MCIRDRVYSHWKEMPHSDKHFQDTGTDCSFSSVQLKTAVLLLSAVCWSGIRSSLHSQMCIRDRNGASPSNDYTPSSPVSITLVQDSVVDEDQYYRPADMTVPQPALYRAFIRFEGSDSSRWISVYPVSYTHLASGSTGSRQSTWYSSGNRLPEIGICPL